MKKFWKNLLVILILILAFTAFSSAYAISLDELNNDPDRYVTVLVMPKKIEYIDKKSIVSYPDKWPYYTLLAKHYLFLLDRKEIAEANVMFRYDWDHSSLAYREQALKTFPNDSDKEIAKHVDDMIKADPGIYWTVDLRSIYSLDGTLLHSFKERNLVISYAKLDWSERINLPLFAFYLYYNKTFHHIYENSNK